MCALGALGFVSFSSLYVRLEPFGYLLLLPPFRFVRILLATSRIDPVPAGASIGHLRFQIIFVPRSVMSENGERRLFLARGFPEIDVEVAESGIAKSDRVEQLSFWSCFCAGDAGGTITFCAPSVLSARSSCLVSVGEFRRGRHRSRLQRWWSGSSTSDPLWHPSPPGYMEDPHATRTPLYLLALSSSPPPHTRPHAETDLHSFIFLGFALEISRLSTQWPNMQWFGR